ncbi:hypothetical protein HJC99_03235 [Candidatus Saccharibacteria bacterium]|nr:hypothetical protein [Candidatus Saccharibacteria bacterium]
MSTEQPKRNRQSGRFDWRELQYGRIAVAALFAVFTVVIVITLLGKSHSQASTVPASSTSQTSSVPASSAAVSSGAELASDAPVPPIEAYTTVPTLPAIVIPSIPAGFPAGTPDTRLLKVNLENFVAAYYQVLPSDNVASRQARIAKLGPAVVPPSVLEGLPLGTDMGTELNKLKAAGVSMTNAAIDLKVAQFTLIGNQMNVKMPVSFQEVSAKGRVLMTPNYATNTPSSASWPVSDWEFHDGTWTLTSFHP